MSSEAWTCITCQVKFSNPDLHREHFKGDWHRYNLKRKVADLPVVGIEQFQTRKELHEKKEKEQGKAEKLNTYCVACGKNFKNVKAYDNHINSKKHQEMILKFEAKPSKAGDEPVKMEEEVETAEDVKDMETVEEVDSDEWEDDDPIPLTDCLFCPKHSSTMDKSLTHMSEVHSFFLPDPEFITNLDGLMEYLGAKVGQGHMCIWCSEKGKNFATKEDVWRHMDNKGHTRLQHEGEALLEYDEWYDYTSSYPDGEGAPADEEVDLDVLDDSGFQLVLPSGATIGHRSLLRYYRQSINPVKAIAIAKAPHGMSSSGRQLLPTYRSLGWTGSSGPAAIQKARDLGYMRRLQQRHWQRLGSKANALRGDTHFKDRNGMCA